MQGYDYNKEGEIKRAQLVGKIALIYNIMAVVVNAVFHFLTLIIIPAVLISQASTGAQYCGYNYYYYYYYNGTLY